jgi:hypothetical protein
MDAAVIVEIVICVVLEGRVERLLEGDAGWIGPPGESATAAARVEIFSLSHSLGNAR